jgi:predicted amidophosphoribosyltransferase
LDLKSGYPAAIPYFQAIIEPEIRNGIAIAVVPSHDPAKGGGGLAALSAALAGNRIDAASSLARNQKIAKLAHGGDRSLDIHMKTISVANPGLIAGRDVLLLDDVTKTGNSLVACRQLLLNAGAKSVQCAAIGKV